MLAGFGKVTVRRMFGGHGIFRDGLMFGIVADETLFLKVDDHNREDFLERNLEPFSYEKQGRRQEISYYQAPVEVFEDPDEMQRWAGTAFSAALRSKSEKN